jgi:hypothetical protein
MNYRLCRYQESNCHNPKQTDGLKKFLVGDDYLNLRLKISILSWLQLFVIQTISRKIRACTRRCCLLPKQNLHKARDLLLPKLISGETDLENLSIKAGQIAA